MALILKEESVLDGETLRQIVAENRQLESDLTKRNEQYIFDLKKALKAANLTEEEITLALHEILPNLVAGQKSGQTARQQFGTVSERVAYVLAKPKETKESEPWKMWLDNTLLFFAMLAILNGIMNLVSKGQGMTAGLLSLVATSATGGLIFYYMYKWIYQYEKPGADKSKKPKMWKSMSILALGMVVWIFIYSGSMLLPNVLNPVVNPIVLVALGGAAFAGRMWFKKKFDIQGSFFNR